MASTKAYLDFILDQLSGLDEITYRAMMSKVFLVRTIWISMLLLAAVTVMMGRETVVQ